MPTNKQLLAWLRETCSGYAFDLAAVYLRTGNHDWPLTANDPDDLHRQLEAGGHFLPLPKEPAALANVLEVSLVDFVLDRVAQASGITAERGTERGYPDIELSDHQHSADCASAPASEALVKMINPAMNIRRRPTRSDIRPPSNRKPPNISA